MNNTNESKSFADKAEQLLRKILGNQHELLSDELLHEIYETLSMREEEKKKEEAAKRELENKRESKINEFRYFEEKPLREMLREHRGLLGAEVLCKIFEAIDLREKERKKKNGAINSH